MLGSCRVSTCEVGWADCNTNPVDGCETPITTLTDCGGCGASCNPPRSAASCATGTCRVIDCDDGWGNCDAVTSNGCETSTETTTDCGACSRSCTLAHSTPDCVLGSCAIASCDAGWTDEDGTTSNGCELMCTGICGDANQDGDVSVVDALRIQRFWMGLEEPTMCATIDADTIRDGTFGNADAIIVQQMILGRVTTSCIPCTLACGDANGDGMLSASDALTVMMRYSVSSPTYDACEYWRFDADGDGGIDMDDAQRIADDAVGSATVSCPERS
jgi:hypothetical protein